MQKFGISVFVFGALSMILTLFDRELVILLWIDTWGTKVGWIIRTSLVVGGLVVGAIGSAMEDEEDSDE